MSDNKIFNVNGPLNSGGKELLAEVLNLAFTQQNPRMPIKAVGYRTSPTHGFILYQYVAENVTLFPCSLTAAQVLPQILAWFDSRPAYECKGWDAEAKSDCENRPGWRVYCEEWGHVDGDPAAFIAVKPAFMWYGK